MWHTTISIYCYLVLRCNIRTTFFFYILDYILQLHVVSFMKSRNIYEIQFQLSIFPATLQNGYPRTYKILNNETTEYVAMRIYCCNVKKQNKKPVYTMYDTMIHAKSFDRKKNTVYYYSAVIRKTVIIIIIIVLYRYYTKT